MMSAHEPTGQKRATESTQDAPRSTDHMMAAGGASERLLGHSDAKIAPSSGSPASPPATQAPARDSHAELVRRSNALRVEALQALEVLAFPSAIFPSNKTTIFELSDVELSELQFAINTQLRRVGELLESRKVVSLRRQIEDARMDHEESEQRRSEFVATNLAKGSKKTIKNLTKGMSAEHKKLVTLVAALGLKIVGIEKMSTKELKQAIMEKTT